MTLAKSFGTLAVLAAFLAACAHGERRSKDHQGEVAVGSTPAQVVMTLGRPSRVYTKETPASEQEIWAYGVEAGEAGGIPRSENPGIIVGDAAFLEIESVVFEKGLVVAVVKRLR
jgi:hypothetical protein